MLFDKARARRDRPGGQVRERLDRVRDDGQRRSIGDPPADPIQHVVGDLPVEGVEGLVEEDVRRAPDDGGREERPFPLTRRKLADRTPGFIGEPERFESPLPRRDGLAAKATDETQNVP